MVSEPYRIRITLDHDQIDAALTGFPIPVLLTAAGPLDFSLARPDGFDVRFVADDFVTELPYERVSWDATAQTAELWVRVPTVAADTDTIIYLYYGDTALGDGADPTAVWDDNFVMVQHMNDTTTSTIADSTQYDNDGTKKGANEPIEAAGIIGKAQNFDGSNDYIDVGDDASLNITNAITYSVWIKPDELGGAQTILSLMYADRIRAEDNNFGFTLFATWDYVTTNNPLNDDVWQFVAATYNKSNVRLYVNESLIAETSKTDNFTGNLLCLLIGVYSSNQYFKGAIDESHISNTDRSAAWLKAEYAAGAGTLVTLTADPATQRSLSGALRFSGGIALRNPRWLRLPNGLLWRGVWNAHTNYGLRDAVIRADSAGTLHAFVSKTTHNTGNDPLGSLGYTYWTRLRQEGWKR